MKEITIQESNGAANDEPKQLGNVHEDNINLPKIKNRGSFANSLSDSTGKRDFEFQTTLTRNDKNAYASGTLPQGEEGHLSKTKIKTTQSGKMNPGAYQARLAYPGLDLHNLNQGGVQKAFSTPRVIEHSSRFLERYKAK